MKPEPGQFDKDYWNDKPYGHVSPTGEVHPRRAFDRMADKEVAEGRPRPLWGSQRASYAEGLVKMAEKKVVAGGKVYKGSAQNGGREIVVKHYKDKSGKWHTTSENAARYEFKKRGGKVSKDQDVDHKNNNKNDNSKGNLRAMSKSANVAKENKRRAGKKS